MDNSPVDIYPNPTSGDITILLTEPWQHERDVNVIVTDQVGTVWMTSHFSAAEKEPHVSMSGLPAGVYFVSVSADHHAYVGKMVKM